MITAEDLRCLANFLVDRHGEIAVDYAQQAVHELEAQGEDNRADAWKALRSVVEDMVEGRLDQDRAIVIH
jgi:hypothetical protein